MMKKLIPGLIILIIFVAGCAGPQSYFGVPNRAMGVPDYFQPTQDAIAKAEQSPGAKNCPDKIAQAKELAKKGAEAFWACKDKEAMDLMAKARALAKEAEACQPKAAAPTPPPAKPEPKPEAKPVPKPEPKPEVKPVALPDLNFDFDKATLTEAAKTALKKDLQTLKQNPGAKVRVEGHACAHGKDDYNLRLSERRANAVKEYLVKEGGIAPDRISTISYGKTRLLMPEKPTPTNKDSKEAKANRRVHFEVVTK